MLFLRSSREIWEHVVSFLFIFIVIVMNLGLGFAAAVHLERVYRLEANPLGDSPAYGAPEDEIRSLLDDFGGFDEEEPSGDASNEGDTPDVDATDNESPDTEPADDNAEPPPEEVVEAKPSEPMAHVEQTEESSAADPQEIEDVLKSLDGLTEDFLADKGKDLAADANNS